MILNDFFRSVLIQQVQLLFRQLVRMFEEVIVQGEYQIFDAEKLPFLLYYGVSVDVGKHPVSKIVHGFKSQIRLYYMVFAV